MAEIRFNLKNKKTNAPTLISLIFRHKGERVVVSTEKKIHPKHWNDNEQLVRKGYAESSIFNSYLKELKSKADKIITSFDLEGKEFSKKEFKERLEIEMGKAEKKKNITLFQFIDKFIEDRELIHPKSSISIYKRTYNHLITFANENKEYKNLNFKDIDLDFLNKFVAFLYAPPRSLAKNYAKKLLQNLKLFMNVALEHEHHSNLKFKLRSFTIQEEEIEKVYLNEHEIKQLHSTQFDNERLERVKDFFVLNCYLGLRFSDLGKIRKENIEEIKGKKILSVNTQKTKVSVKIPLKSEAIEILEKYDYRLPSVISNQKFNKALKEIGSIANLDSQKTISRTKGGRYVSQTKTKADLLTTHVARRSFATNLLLAKVPAIQIMDLTGHKSMRQFMEYVAYDKLENAINLSDNEYFK